MATRSLQAAFQPKLVTIELSCRPEALREAEAELRSHSLADDNHCYGYFPGMKANQGVDANLPHSQRFAQAVPTLFMDDKLLQFNFMRMSLVRQHGDSPFHLDSDAATALTGDVDTVSERLVWRLLLNVSDDHPRTLAYVDVDPSTVTLTSQGGYIHCEDAKLTAKYKKTIAIPPRRDLRVSGVLFCASRVLHTGQDDEHGHFVMGYGCEEPSLVQGVEA